MRRRGQVLLEFAISLAGIVTLFMVIMKAWTWMNTTLIERQASFESTRQQAGDDGTAYVPYQRPPLSLIGPASGGAGQTPPDILIEPAPPCDAAVPFYEEADAKLQAAEAITAQFQEPIQILWDEYEANELQLGVLGAEAVATEQQIEDLNNQIASLEVQIELLQAGCWHDWDNGGWISCDPATQAQIDSLTAELNAAVVERDALGVHLADLNAQIQQLEARQNEILQELGVIGQGLQAEMATVQQLIDEAGDLFDQGRAACDG